MASLYNYWQCITSFETSLGKIERRMSYVVSVITFSVILVLLWDFTLLVFYKLYRFCSPILNQFDIHTLLFCVYYRFIPIDKMIYIYNGNLTYCSLLMSQFDLIFFRCVMDSYCNLFNCPLRIILIALRRYMCLSYCLSG